MSMRMIFNCSVAKIYMAMRSIGVLTILVVSCVNYGLSYCPSGIIEQGLSEADRRTIVDKHNQLRDQVSQGDLKGQPRATNMKRMKYSMILEQKAQEIASTCEVKHVKVKGTQWSWVGQNLYYSSSPENYEGADWNGAIQLWFDEYKVYTFGSPFSMKTGHYTQVVWADTDSVGCGYAYYAKNGGYQKYIVCNYGPGGNVIGEKPYRT